MFRRSARLEKLQAKSYSISVRGSISKKVIEKPSVNGRNTKKQRKSKSIENLTKINKVSENNLSNKNITVSMTSTTSSNLALRKYDVSKAWSHIKSVDKELAKYMSNDIFLEFQQRVLRADGFDPFNSLVTSIIYQQIHGRAAASIKNRFLRLFEKDTPIVFPAEDPLPSTFKFFPTPKMVLSKSTEQLRFAGLSQRKTEYIQDLARVFDNKTINGELLGTMSDEEISDLLCSVKGVGQWTVDMFLMFNLCHPNVLPVTDLGVRRGVALHFNLKTIKDKKNRPVLPSPEEMRQLTTIWEKRIILPIVSFKPYRSLGSWLMWKIQDIKSLAD